MSTPSPHEQLEILTAPAVDLHVREELLQKLAQSAATGRPLRVKLGLDPTSPDLHLGHTVVLQEMRRFQDLGHQGVLVVGDFTARIGDPTGRHLARPPLSAEAIAANARTYQAQALLVLDPARTELRFNSEWLARLGADGLLTLLSSYSLARMMERDDFRRRWEEGRPLSLHELAYPLLQAQDSVALEADVELGGTDQLFNLLVGRTLMRERGMEPQVVMTTPILEGLDARLVDGKLVGEKMSKSLGNYVGVTEPPKELFGKLMSVSDELMWRYYQLLSSRSAAEVAALRGGHPKQAKVALAKELVARFHSPAAAEEAAAEFERVFARGAAPEGLELVRLPPTQASLVEALVGAKLCASKSEARRKIAEGAVDVDQERCQDAARALPPGEHLLRLGRRYARVAVG